MYCVCTLVHALVPGACIIQMPSAKNFLACHMVAVDLGSVLDMSEEADYVLVCTSLYESVL